MSTPAKLALGIATIWPIVYMVLFIGGIFAIMAIDIAHAPAAHSAAAAHNASAPPDAARAFLGVMAIHLLTMLEMLGLTIFYVVHVVRNANLSSEMRIVWLLIVMLAGPIGMPVYWFVNIWRTPPTLPQRSLEQR